jgi:hypothetical protein
MNNAFCKNCHRIPSQCCCITAKTLTDDEIEEFAYAFELWQLNNPNKTLEGIIDFAKAILRKAQEK